MTKKRPPAKMTKRQRTMATALQRARFAAEFCVDFNGTQAAIRAGYSAKSAYGQACRLLKDEEVQRLILEGQQRAIARTEITQDRILQGAANIAFGKLRDLFDERSMLLGVKDLADEAAEQVAGIEILRRPQGDYVHKVRLNSRLGALELLGRYHKMWTDKVEHGGAVSLAGLDEKAISELSNEELLELRGHAAAAVAVLKRKKA